MPRSPLASPSVTCVICPRHHTVPTYPRSRADATVRIQPLASGYSSEVHGIITVAVSSPMQGAGGAPGRQPQGAAAGAGVGAGPLVLHYKALDSGIRCMVSTNTAT